MAKASKNKKNTTDQEIEPVIDTTVPVEPTVEIQQDTVEQSVQEPTIEPIVNVAEELPTETKTVEVVEQELLPIEPIVEDTIIEKVVETIPEPVVEEIAKPIEKTVDQVIEKTPEPIPTIPEIHPVRVGKLLVTDAFLKSTPTFFTWLHKQGYAILGRELNKNGDTTFTLEGNSLDAIIGEPPMYSVTVGNRLHIVRK